MITPTSETELAEAIRDAQAPLRVQGGGTRPIGNVDAEQALTTSGLSGIKLYEPGALTLVVAAGTPMADIEDALAAENQILPFEPMDHRALLGTKGAPTIGGVVAANVSGPRRVQAGACRDSLIGVRFVDGTGTVLKNGGRVMKNVTGYDLVKLMAGSYGTLGVLTEVAFKVLPAPGARAVVLINGQTVDEAVATMSKALSSPFEVSGAAYTPSGIDDHPVTMIRVEGFEASVSYRAAQLTELLAGPDDIAIETDPDNTKAGWGWVRDVHSLKDETGDLWRISVKPSDAPAVVGALGGAKTLLDWGGGLIWAATANGTDIRAAMNGIPGHATCIRGNGANATFHPEPAPIAAISRGLREKFDPQGLLNPGLMT